VLRQVTILISITYIVILSYRYCDCIATVPIIILNDFNNFIRIVCINCTNKELNIINLHGATTKVIYIVICLLNLNFRAFKDFVLVVRSFLSITSHNSL